MIRRIRKEDKKTYLEMAEKFYNSDAVLHNIPKFHLTNTFEELIKSDTYVLGYIMEQEGAIAGYALLSKSYSQEAGGSVLWIEEIFILPEFRGYGLGSEFFTYLEEEMPVDTKRVRLEIEMGNKKAASLYRKMGFEDFPYAQMVKEIRS